jgi:NDP-sugar pyrophosphorylase family protein
MKAMIFAAGLGTRLQPFTNHQPKALVEVAGEPMLGRLIKHLRDSGFKQIILNVHHFADKVKDYLEENHNFGLEITVSDETDLLLDTGGGLKKAGWFFQSGEPFLLHNVDIFSDMDLIKLMNTHKSTGAMATLVVRERPSSRYFLCNEEMQLCGWENTKTGEKKISRNYPVLTRYAFSGIHVLSPEIFKNISETGVFSIVDLYLRLARDHKILAYPENKSTWVDMGKKQGLDEAERFFHQDF